MSKLIAVRIPDDLFALVEEASGSTSEIVVSALRQFLEDEPSTFQMATAADPGFLAGNSSMKNPQAVYSQPIYSRPAHDPTCRCFICKPPK